MGVCDNCELDLEKYCMCETKTLQEIEIAKLKELLQRVWSMVRYDLGDIKQNKQVDLLKQEVRKALEREDG